VEVQCPHCQRTFEVALTAKKEVDELPSRYRRTVEFLRHRDTPPAIGPVIPKAPIDPDRPQ